MQRTLHKSSLLFASISAIIGSGWLFAAYYTAISAGPSALISWIIGGFIAITIAFVFAEITAMIPVTGSSTRIPHYTHGTLVSFLFAWIIWLSYVTLSATEVQAVIQYLSFYFPSLTHHDGGLTKEGYFCAIVLLWILSTLNIYSLRWLIRTNTILTAIKIFIPVFISLIILSYYGSFSHIFHPAYSQFIPNGIHGIFGAITTGGIVFAFNGFKQSCEMAGEAKHPQTALPYAIIGSVLVTLVIYLILQMGFLSSIDPNNLRYGWSHLDIMGGNSPFAGIIDQDHLTWLLPIIYIGAILAPLAAGLMYINSAARSLYAQSKNGYLPAFIQQLFNGNPAYAIAINVCLSFFLFMPLHGWDAMVTFLASSVSITYAIAPITLLALRKQVPNQERPFKLPFAFLWSYVAFYFCTLMIYWSGWSIVKKMGIALLMGLIVLFGYYFFTKRGRKIQFHWRASIWAWPYFIGITIISYYGNFGNGKGLIPFGWDFLLIAAFSFIILLLAVYFRLPSEITRGFLNDIELIHLRSGKHNDGT